MRRRALLGHTLVGAGLYAARRLGLPPDALAAEVPQRGGQVVVGLSQEPTVFNPFKPHIEVDRGVHMCVFDTLWKMTNTGQLVPNLAAAIPSVENGGISRNGLEYTFRLKRGIRWHDGAPFTAADVVFSWKMVMNPSFVASLRAGYDQIESASAPNPYTVRFRLKAPYAPMLALWSDTYIVPSHLLSHVKDVNHNGFDDHPIGTGPFKWVQRVPGDHITLDANKAYHGPGPYMDRVVFKYIPDLTVLFERFKTGDVDVTGIQGITVDHYQEAKALPGVRIYTTPTNFVEYIWFNLGLPQFKDLAVRQALYYAMDKDAIIKQIYYGVMIPSESYLSPSSWAFNPNLPKHVYDPAKARTLLEEAGWAVGPGGVRAKNGVKLSFLNSTTAGNHVREQAQALLQQNWKQVGIEMQIKDLPPAVMWGDYFKDSQYNTAMVGINILGESGGDPNAISFFDSHYIPIRTKQGNNNEQYVNPRVDQLLEAGVVTTDQAKRAQMYREVQAILRHDLPYLPIFYYVFIEGTKAALQNYVQNPNVVSNMWNVNTWWWKK